VRIVRAALAESPGWLPSLARQVVTCGADGCGILGHRDGLVGGAGGGNLDGPILGFGREDEVPELTVDAAIGQRGY